MPSTNENLGSNTAKLAEDPNHRSTLQSLISRSLGIGISFLGASSVVATTFNTNLLPAAASTADYSGYTLDLDVRRSQKTNIDYPWNDENQNHVMGGEHGSRTVADLNPERDIPELGLTEGQGQKLVGLGFVRHSNFGNGGGFLYLNSKPYQAIVKPDGVERLCLVVKVNSEGVQTHQTFTSLDFNDLMDKCRELNTLHNSGQEASHTPPVQIDLSNPKLQQITAHQDQAIQKILEVTEEYSKAGYLDKIGEQAGRLRALANKLENPVSLRNLNITNSNVYGGVTGQSDYGTLGGTNTNNYGEDLENMVLGPNPNSLSKSEVRMLGKRFQQELIKIQDALNYYITHPAAQNHTIRYLLANYLGQGGPVPEGIIGEGTNRGGEIAREESRTRTTTTEEPNRIEERPRESNSAEDSAPCTSSLTKNDLAQLTREFQTQVALKQLNSGVAFAGDLTQLKAGDYNLLNGTDGELEARVLCGNWREKFANQLESKGGHFKQLPIEGEYKFIPPADKGGSPIFERVNFRGRTGLVDKYGNNWIPDATSDSFGRQNFHWDVQHKNGLHTNVNPDGSINHGKNGGNNFPVIPK